MNKNPLKFSDLSLIKAIQKRYESDFLSRDIAKDGFYIPIDIHEVAKIMKVNPKMVFQRLHFHLNKKYGYNQGDGSKVEFFAPGVGDMLPCINYPYLCAVLGNMEQERSKHHYALYISLFAMVIAVATLFASMLFKEPGMWFVNLNKPI